MTLEQFQSLAHDNRADSVMKVFAVAVFKGPWGTVSIEFADVDGVLTAPDLEVVTALHAAARLTGKFAADEGTKITLGVLNHE